LSFGGIRPRTATTKEQTMKTQSAVLITALVTVVIAQSAFAGGGGSGRSSSGRSSYGYSTGSKSYGGFSTESYKLPSYSTRSYGGSTKIYTPPGVQNYRSTTVSPYVKRDGTFVGPSFRSTPNRSVNDNWSTKGNSNPFTGQKGSRRLMQPWETQR